MRMPSVRALGDRYVEASEPVSRRFSLMLKRHGDSLMASWASPRPHRAHVAEGNPAMQHEFLDARRAAA
jgi:hypothetical protein